MPEVDTPIGEGWYLDGTGILKPQLEAEDPLPKDVTDLVSCKCKACNTARCTCRSKNLKCFAACSCNEQCKNPLNISSNDESETEH